MTDSAATRRIPLDLTHVLYEESSATAFILALLTLSPILVNPAYAVLSVQTRELFFIEMWAGQMLCEGFNWIIKHLVREERPHVELGEGFAFPSSHSQWMGFFVAFLISHLIFRHRFYGTGYFILDILWKATVFLGLVGWALAVAFSRYYLSYHTPRQVAWGLIIGVLFGAGYYVIIEVLPAWRPDSLLGHTRAAVLANPICTWFRIRDGWAVWADGGTEAEWRRWRAEWDRKRSTAMEGRELKHE